MPDKTDDASGDTPDRSQQTAIVWLRRDLRTHDNPALAHAAEHYGRVCVAFIHAPHEEKHGERTQGLGGASQWWLHHSLAALDAELKDIGGTLTLRAAAPQGGSLVELKRLIDDCEADAVFWNRRYEPAIIARDTQIKSTLQDDLGLEVQTFNGSLLVEPWTVETKSGGPYKVYTPFWKSVGPRLGGLETLDAPELPTTPRVDSADLDSLDLLPDLDWADGFSDYWTPGSRGAHDALERFFDDAMPDYADGRDQMSEHLTSRLSPHLHWGEISPRYIVQRTHEQQAADDRRGAQKGSETFLKELVWREFAYHLIYHFPDTVDAPLNSRFDKFPWEDHPQWVTAWQRGQTGIPIVDAGMRQLWTRGWMHNRVRMIVGSLLTKNLRTHWHVGADWFWDCLVDADLASNTLGWQWIAGSGADAAPYFRVFNPITQSERFDAAAYIREFVPELAKLPDDHIHAPWDAPDAVRNKASVKLGSDYPEPIVDVKDSRKAALAAYDQVKG